MIEHVADLDVHGPIRPYEHVARGAFHHGIHHLLRSPVRFETLSEIGDSPTTINRTTGAIGEHDSDTALSLSLSLSKETKIDARVWWIPLLRERFGMGLELEV